MSLYLVLKLAHIGAVIVAVGANVTYSFWRRQAGTDRDRIAQTLDGIRRLDRRVANPAYLVALLAGLGMVAIGPYPLSEPWILAAIVLYVLVALLGITLYAPAVRRQRAAALSDPTSAGYHAAARRSDALGLVALAIVALIVFLMVVKPG
jgi:uncharacterized membrane protein